MTNKTSIPQPPIDTHDLFKRVEHLLHVQGPRFRRLWAYYRNPMLAPVRCDGLEVRPYRQAQEWGLPPRLTGVTTSAQSEFDQAQPLFAVARKQVVIENDIGWRIDTMVDYLFGTRPVIVSTAPDPARASVITHLLNRILDLHGGLTFLQTLGTLGAVHGFVDVMVKLSPDTHQNSTLPDGAAPSPTGDAANSVAGPTPTPPRGGPNTGSGSDDDDHPADRPILDESTDTGASHPSPGDLDRLARQVRLEIVEPPRALPVLAGEDWRRIVGYAQVYRMYRSGGDRNRHTRRHAWITRLLSRRFRPSSLDPGRDDEQVWVVDFVAPGLWKRYEDGQLVQQGTHLLNRVPVVHIQNLPRPFEYSGSSDVEPLIPIQDELNTCLSDRAHRIAVQSFKMFLAKGIDESQTLQVAPGQVWNTDNDQASVQEFGGDSGSPSEARHIAELREAMDKISAVSPIAAGVLRDRIGRLTSAVALRITLLALLGRTERKRATFGQGITELCALALEWLDAAGLFHTGPEERHITIHWPNPIPQNLKEQLQEARLKRAIGVPKEQVLKELGYAPDVQTRQKCPM